MTATLGTLTTATASGSLTVAHYSRLTATRASVRTRTWNQLTEELSRHTVRGGKDGPLWSPVLFADDAPKQRANANVAALTAAVLETDHTAPDWGQLDGLAFVAHTTHSHADDDPHWRIVVALAEPVAVADWPEAWARIVDRIAPAADPACKDVSRAYYLPTARPGAPTDARAGSGAPLDWRSLPPVATPAADIRASERPTPEPRHVEHAPVRIGGAADRPGDVFNRAVDWPEILEPHGWRIERQLPDGSCRWTRPGKADGVSATTDGGGQRVLYVFSSSAPPFDPGESVTRFEAWTRLEHGGDRTAATRAAAERFGLALPERDYLAPFTNEVTRLELTADDLADVRELPPSDETPEQMVARLTLELAQARTIIAERDHTIGELRAIIGEYKAADRLARHGPFTPDGAAVHKHLVTAAAAARANGRARVSLERKDVARVALGTITDANIKAVSRAFRDYKPYQDDPELSETLPYRLEWREGGRRTHIDLVPLVVSQQAKADAYRTLERLPKDRRPPAPVRDRDDTCPRCHGAEGVESRSTKRCLNDACGHTWHTRPVVLGRTPTPENEPEHQPALLVSGLPGQIVPANTGLTQAGHFVPATDGAAESNGHTHLTATTVIPVPNRVPGQIVPAPPVSSVSSADQEDMARVARVLVPYEPPASSTGPWRCPPPCGSYEGYARDDGSWRCGGCGRVSQPR